MNTLRIAMAQINPTVGDLTGNADLILEYLQRASAVNADITLFPELALPGYPPEDLLLKPHFARANRRALERIIAASKKQFIILGFVDTDGSDIYNGAAVIVDGQLIDVYHKTYLPNYGVFDEERYFQAGRKYPVYVWGEARLGVNICEDIWYPGGPDKMQSLMGDAHLIINISASPYHANKTYDRERMLCTRAEDNAAALAYCNLVGGQDELVFDGNSLIINEGGHIIARGKAFEEDFIVADINLERVFAERLHDPRRRREKIRLTADESLYLVVVKETERNSLGTTPITPFAYQRLDEAAEVYAALVLGVGDYIRKNAFDKVYLGLSGGVDSALTAVIAADAIGAENVYAVFMPTNYSASESARDAELLAKNLGIHYQVIAIQEAFEDYLKMFAPLFQDLPVDVTEENLQARIRGNILMALSNKFRGLVLSTGNKSEMSVGYSTLYGDMVGGFAVLKDVPKTLVYRLCQYVNQRDDKPVIPEYIITRPPSAELRPDQKDQDTLPPYVVLDAIIEAYVEDDMSAEAIAQMGFAGETVRWVINRIDAAEYKRRQSPPGIKITPRAFGRDRRMPITSKFHH
ncbi:MAG: NAD+ synthase [Acidobacteria bacterium]|nr:NAD+ synthase [Acidobacteriota bacterium]